MIWVDTDYRDSLTRRLLVDALTICQAGETKLPVFLCIGSDRHLLDCFGPLTGTLLQERLPQLNVYGTLDQPLHARNLTREMIIIKNRHPRQKYIAIDAAVGEEHEIGRLQLRNGPIYPGKATAKSLPAVGDYALTAILEKRGHKAAAGRGNSPGFAAVYHMAKIVQQAVADWYDLYPQ